MQDMNMFHIDSALHFNGIPIAGIIQSLLDAAIICTFGRHRYPGGVRKTHDQN
jgi:hypothetical protein